MSNVALGMSALGSNTTGEWNTEVGAQALPRSTICFNSGSATPNKSRTESQ